MQWQVHTRCDSFMGTTELWLSYRDERTGTTYCAWIEQGQLIMRNVNVGPEFAGMRVDQGQGFYPLLTFSTHEVIAKTAEGVLGALAQFHAEQQPGYRPSTSIEVDLLREQLTQLQAEIRRRDEIAERRLDSVIDKALER